MTSSSKATRPRGHLRSSPKIEHVYRYILIIGGVPPARDYELPKKPWNQVMEVLERLQKWYEAQCNRDWEHDYGVLIENLDNPGWMVTVDLSETELEDKEFNEVLDERSETDWIDCVVTEGKFRGMGGPLNLTEILTVFLVWTESDRENG